MFAMGSKDPYWMIFQVITLVIFLELRVDRRVDMTGNGSCDVARDAAATVRDRASLCSDSCASWRGA
jgi:hypothetical protein